MDGKRLSDLGEVEAIRRILRTLEPVMVEDPCLPIDDDVQAIDGCRIAVKIDGYSERASRYPWEDPSDWGWRAITGPISDLSAKGYRAVGIVYSLGIPKEESFDKVKKIVRGIREALEHYGVPFLGGDLNSSGSETWIDVAAVGILSSPSPVSRRGAKPGESVYTTMLNGYGKPGLLYKFYVEGAWQKVSPKLLKFRPRAVMRFPELLSSLRVSSSMDSSDGLVKTLKAMAEGSKVSIELEKLPVTKQTRKILRMHGVDVEHAVLFGGEEYEVVFTSSEDENEVMGSCGEKGIRCMKIGKVLRGRGKVYFRGKELVGGWDQFRGHESP
ncbi:MAG: thiamine-phosphate kinase [Fervidicoccaceae archaeon]|jgi:thiamine-monophosphate kinase